jgi:phage terminase small subunit
MPVLKKPRHEIFPMGVATGLSLTQAYIRAGYKPRGARHSARRLLAKNPDVAARVIEIRMEISTQIEARIKLLLERQRRKLTLEESDLLKRLWGEAVPE